MSRGQGKKGLRLQQGGSFGLYRDDVGSYGLQIVVHEVLGFWVEGLAFGLHSWVRGFEGPCAVIGIQGIRAFQSRVLRDF